MKTFMIELKELMIEWGKFILVSILLMPLFIIIRVIEKIFETCYKWFSRIDSKLLKVLDKLIE